jgi:hypothetical protein
MRYSFSMKRHLILFDQFLVYKASFGKTEIPEFDVVEVSGLRMKECAFEKNASAMT